VSSLYTSNAVMNVEICARALTIRITGLSGTRSSIETTSRRQANINATKIHANILATLKYLTLAATLKDEAHKRQGSETAFLEKWISGQTRSDDRATCRLPSQ